MSMKMSSGLAYFNQICKNSLILNFGSKHKPVHNILSVRNPVFISNVNCLSRHFHVGLMRNKAEDRRKMLASLPPKDEGTEGELSVGIESIKSRQDMFPSEDTPNMLVDGIPFKDIPICNIRVSPNNTILTLSEAKTGNVRITRSCGIEGFKNTRKGTNVAAQATAISFSSIALSKGFKTVRVNVRGLGPGRLSAIKGLQMGGLNIISVSDTTPVSDNPPRPRRPKSL
ncbi:mitochondrial ribosomal protein S11 [Lycorma delicatula]|uniref:mitochondrial ribosomal protein S11 n=1 Tax=Lycorma delicatula TaxID=130591 RepID=UPI003F50E534